MEEMKKGFNWLAFLGAGAYYSGKGNFKKGLVLALLNFMPIMSILIGVHCGMRANKELDTTLKFNWKNAIITAVLQIIIFVSAKNFLSAFK